MTSSEFTDISVEKIVFDTSTSDGKFGGRVADVVEEKLGASSVGATEPVVCDTEELALLFERPGVPAGRDLIPETAPRVDGWKERSEADDPVSK